MFSREKWQTLQGSPASEFKNKGKRKKIHEKKKIISERNRSRRGRYSETYRESMKAGFKRLIEIT